MIAAANGKQAVLARPARCLPVLQRHLERDFHTHRAGIAKKHVLQWLRRHAHQTFAQLHCRAVGEAAKHDMGHVFDLFPEGCIQSRMAIAMDRAPPRRHAINQFAAIRQTDAHPLCRNHRIDRQGTGHGGVGMPEVAAVKIKGSMVKAMFSHGAAPAQRCSPGGVSAPDPAPCLCHQW